MGRFGQAMKSLYTLIFPGCYCWPATDIRLHGSQFHLVGSIHMGTRDMMPLPAALQQKLARADGLIVEADITSVLSPFGHSEPCQPLELRLSAAHWRQLCKLCDDLGIDSRIISPLPAWQVALILQAQQAQQLGLRPEYGIDYQLLQAAHRHHLQITELEGPQLQLDLLAALPQGGQSLLEDTLIHWHTNARLLQTLISWWLDASPVNGGTPLPSPFRSTLNDLLMLQRNARWSQHLRQLPPGNYVVAVGALHLYGEHNLVELLKARNA